jgi:ABC-type glutathione transport system ATPase component
MDELLSVEGLRVSYRDRERTVRAVDGLDLTLREGRTLALVGESGCGKTTAALAILGLVPSPGRVDGGRVLFEGRDVYTLKPD